MPTNNFWTGKITILAALLAVLLISPPALYAQQEERKPLFVGAWPYLLPPEGHFNTFVTGGLTFGIYQQVIEEPLALYLWHNDTYIPWLATSWEIAGEYFIVHLRQGVTFHDGTPFTAKDVAGTWLIHYILNHPLYSLGFVDKVEIVDDYTVRFHIKKPSPILVRYILREPVRAYSVYKDFVDKAMDYMNQGLTPTADPVKQLAAEFRNFRPDKYIGTGPFMWIGEITEAEVWFKFYENYWNKDRVKFRWLKLINGETPQVTPHVLAKEVDYATHGFPPATEQQFKELGIRIIRPPIYSGPAIYFNMKIWPLNETWFRKAIAYAINTTENGWVSLSESGRPVRLASGLPIELNDIWLTSETKQKLEIYEYNPEKAAQILQEHGFTKGADGWWRYPNGTIVEFELSFPAEYADWSAAAENAAAQLRKFGIRVTTRAITYTQHPLEVWAGNFQLAIRHWGGGANPHPYFHFYAPFIYWNEREAGVGEGRPGISFPLVQDTKCCGRVDIRELVTRVAEGFDIERTRQITNTLTLVFNELLPCVILWQRYGNNPSLDGVRVTGWPPDSDPIFKNPPYGDAFVVFMLLTGYGLQPTPENMPTPPAQPGQPEQPQQAGLPQSVIIAAVVVIVIVAVLAWIMISRRGKRG
ncbi:MAG: ABC transporter substrate-binding protein [Thermofilaceae archaeon]